MKPLESDPNFFFTAVDPTGKSSFLSMLQFYPHYLTPKFILFYRWGKQLHGSGFFGAGWYRVLYCGA